MGCVCCSLSSFVSILLDALERISLCTVCAMLTCCLLFTIITVMVLGIGIGFHYCFVQSSVEAMGRAAKAAGALRSGSVAPGPVMRSVDQAIRRGGFPKQDNYRERREVDNPPLTNNNTLNQQLNSTLHTHNVTSINYIQFFNITRPNSTKIKISS